MADGGVAAASRDRGTPVPSPIPPSVFAWVVASVLATWAPASTWAWAPVLRDSGNMNRFRLVVAALSLFALSSAAACSSSSSKTATNATTTTVMAGPTVVAKNISFIPSTIQVHAGDTVTWQFKDGIVVHNVDGKGSLGDFYSGNPQSSGTYQYTFTKAGTYSYRCDVHPAMTAKVVVS